MLLVGLTGGIGSGKSTVAAMFTELGAHVIDADAIARQVVEPGTPALAQLVEHFGPGILDADGRLDRPKLAELAFASDDQRKALDAITHPAINTEFLRRVTEAPSDGIVVMDVPLLVESKLRNYECVVVVETPPELRLDRLEGRGVGRADAQARMAAQATDEERRAVADHVIENGGDLASLALRVDEVWADLLARAAAKAAADAPADGAPEE